MILGILLASVISEFLAVVVWCSRRASGFSQSCPCCFRPPATRESPWSRNWTNNKQSTEQFFLLLRSASTWNGVMRTETVFYMASFYDEPRIFQWLRIRHLHIFQSVTSAFAKLLKPFHHRHAILCVVLSVFAAFYRQFFVLFFVLNLYLFLYWK